MKKFKIVILVEDNGQDDGKFYAIQTLKNDISLNIIDNDLSIVEITVEEC